MKTKVFGVLSLSVVLSIFRIYIIGNVIETDSGFYIRGNRLPDIFNILLVLAAVFCMTVLFNKKLKMSAAISDIKSGWSVFSYISLGISFLACGILYYFRFTSNVKVDSLELFIMFLSFFAAILMIVASAAMNKKEKPFSICYMILSPSIWFAICLISEFKGLTTIVAISEYLYEVLTICVIILFFYYFARLFIGSKTYHKAAFYGLLSIMGIFVSVLPKFYYYILGTENVFITSFKPEYVVYAVCLIFIPVNLIVLSKRLTPEIVLVESDEESETEENSVEDEPRAVREPLNIEVEVNGEVTEEPQDTKVDEGKFEENKDDEN